MCKQLHCTQFMPGLSASPGGLSRMIKVLEVMEVFMFGKVRQKKVWTRIGSMFLAVVFFGTNVAFAVPGYSYAEGLTDVSGNVMQAEETVGVADVSADETSSQAEEVAYAAEEAGPSMRVKRSPLQWRRHCPPLRRSRLRRERRSTWAAMRRRRHRSPARARSRTARLRSPARRTSRR